MAKILTKAELACLLEVKTTVAQARTILKRNRAMLKLAEKRKNGYVFFACPHCAEAFKRDKACSYVCGHCAYTPKELGDLEYWCTQYSFGGIVAKDVAKYISLFRDNAYVYGQRIAIEDRETVLRWIGGHIEWAEEVIRRGRSKK